MHNSYNLTYVLEDRKSEVKREIAMKTQTWQEAQHNKKHMPKPHEVVVIFTFIILVSCLGFILIAGLLSNQRPNMASIYAQQTLMAMNATQGTPEVEPNQTQTPSPTPSPTPTEKVLQKPEGQVNILLLGSDSRVSGGVGRTDTIIWVSLNPRDRFVSAVSFPRDMFVPIPGMGENRINVAFPRGGFDLLADTFEHNLGIRPDYYILIDMNSFVSLVNSLGGIQVQASRNLSDNCARWINSSGYCSVGPGTVQMDGDVALWYVRSRYSTNDIDRARRGQEVTEAIFNRLMSLDAVLRAPDLFNAFSTTVRTDLKFGNVVTLLPLATRIYESRDIRNYVIDYDQVYAWRTPQGAQVLVPDFELIKEVMIEALLLE